MGASPMVWKITGEAPVPLLIDYSVFTLKLASAGLGLTGDELKEAVDPAYNLEAMRNREKPVTYGRKPRSR